MEVYLLIGVMTIFAYGMVLLVKKYPQLKNLLPLVGRVSGLIAWYLDKREFKKAYTNNFYMVQFITNGLIVNTDFDYIQGVITSGIYGIYKQEHGLSLSDIRRVSLFVSDLVENNDEIVHSIQALLNDRLQDVEVRKLTVLAIDVLAHLFDLKDELSSDYYQHLVYAINRVLVNLRDHGLTKKGVRKSGAILFRLYKLTRAYQNLKGPKTAEDLKNALQDTLDTFFG